MSSPGPVSEDASQRGIQSCVSRSDDQKFFAFLFDNISFLWDICFVHFYSFFIFSYSNFTQKPDSGVSTPAAKKVILKPEFPISPITTKNKGDGSNEEPIKKLPCECPVTVSVKWSNRTIVNELKPQLSSLGKMLCRDTTKQIAKAAWNFDALKKYLHAEVAKEINKECVAMCRKGSAKDAKKRKSSCLRQTEQKSIAEFTFDGLIKELEERAPLLFNVLKSAASKGREYEMKWKPAVCMAAAVRLHNRSQNMIAMQLPLLYVIQGWHTVRSCNREPFVATKTFFFQRLQFTRNFQVQQS